MESPERIQLAKIGVIDYLSGNLGSVINALQFLGCDTSIICNGAQFKDVDGVILPGVGAFGRAMKNLENRDFITPLNDHILGEGIPFFGICIGMQLLARGSTEDNGVKGLSWIDCDVKHILPNRMDDPSVMRPHVGWNTVTPIDSADPMFARLKKDEAFYFDHSFAMEAPPSYISAYTNYHDPIPVMIRKNNLMAAQFHPEKSHRAGLIMLRNFTNLVKRASKSSSMLSGIESFGN